MAAASHYPALERKGYGPAPAFAAPPVSQAAYLRHSLQLMLASFTDSAASAWVAKAVMLSSVDIKAALRAKKSVKRERSAWESARAPPPWWLVTVYARIRALKQHLIWNMVYMLMGVVLRLYGRSTPISQALCNILMVVPIYQQLQYASQ